MRFSPCLLIAFILPFPAAAQSQIPAGEDVLGVVPATPPQAGRTVIDFRAQPIPAGAIAPGSDAFTGIVEFVGVDLVANPAGALDGAHAILRRPLPSPPLTVGMPTVVPARWVGLSLRSAQPVIVTFGGATPTAYDVTLSLSPTAPQPMGTATIVARTADLGTTTYDVPALLAVRFSAGGATSSVDPYGPIPFVTDQTPWRLEGGPSGFVASAEGIESLPAGVSFDGDGNGTLEAMSLGTQAYFSGVTLSCSGATEGSGARYSSGMGGVSTMSLDPFGDRDGDRHADVNDNCPDDFNPRQTDTDGDGLGDVCDPNPKRPNTINEMLVSMMGPDDEEYLELAGPAGALLDGLAIAILDGDDGSAGVLDTVIDLTGYTVPSDGYFVLGQATTPNVDLVLASNDFFENGTQTVYLVEITVINDLQQWLGVDMDGDDDRVSELPCVVDDILDRVGLWDGGSLDRLYDGAGRIAFGPVAGGPNGALAVPAGVFRSGGSPDFPGEWCGAAYLPFAVGMGPVIRTPGEANPDCAGDFSGSGFCYGDGAGTACPCMNEGIYGAGCAGSTGVPVTLRGVGDPSVSNGDWRLEASGLPANTPALFMVGTAPAAGGAGIATFDGLLCVGGSVVRVERAATDPVGYVTSLADFSTFGVMAGDTRYYQCWYRDLGPGTCGTRFNYTGGWQVTWLP